MSSICSLSREMRSSPKRHTRPAGWRRPLGCFISGGHFSKKSHIISGSFAKRDLQLKASYASSPPCTALIRDLLHRETKTHKKLSVLKKHTRVLLCSKRDQPNRAPRRHRKATILKKDTRDLLFSKETYSRELQRD